MMVDNQGVARVLTPRSCCGLACSRWFGPDGPPVAPDSYRCFPKATIVSLLRGEGSAFV
jgi:hypothetical protein